MYRTAYQCGLLSIFFSVGQKPLLNWKAEAKSGNIKRLTDPAIRSLVLDIRGTNFCTKMPLFLHPGWNTVVFDLNRLMEYCYKQRLLEVTRVRINANCRLRRVYFCDRAYSDDEIPKDYRIQVLQ
ncbi:unnamed protein product [Dibothriocephalus latus]|uniref:CFA20 domain-containing protein n=1 Tax=Dibothriocephalus latus TaxID=60516 RepID=A0A3P7NSC0_DIBLA|nr:unnamed protein product [Dibothriocephalus latus]